MVSLDKIREEMKKRLELDNQLFAVDVHADTVEEALADASVQLDTKLSCLQYEVIEKGSNGFLGIGKKPWKLKIYQNAESIKKKKLETGGLSFDEEFGTQAAEKVVRDGLFYVRRFGSSIYLKVLLPQGGGREIDEKEVFDNIERADTENFDKKLVNKFLSSGTDGQYEKVGTYKHINSADAIISVDISKDELHGFIIVDAPAMSGSDVSRDQIIKAMKAQGVSIGISEEKISEFVDNPVYSAPFEVATAIMPEDGHDSYVSYNFETDITKLKARESDGGNVDFKELNRIQNVVAGQVLATKVVATRGRGGKTLYGHYLEAKNGKDLTKITVTTRTKRKITK